MTTKKKTTTKTKVEKPVKKKFAVGVEVYKLETYEEYAKLKNDSMWDKPLTTAIKLIQDVPKRFPVYVKAAYSNDSGEASFFYEDQLVE